jgi:hypothetical protein
MYIYKLERGQSHSIGVVLLGFWGIFREKGLSREIGTY